VLAKLVLGKQPAFAKCQMAGTRQRGQRHMSLLLADSLPLPRACVWHSAKKVLPNDWYGPLALGKELIFCSDLSCQTFGSKKMDKKNCQRFGKLNMRC
jgi:hypothetical protein